MKYQVTIVIQLISIQTKSNDKLILLIMHFKSIPTLIDFHVQILIGKEKKTKICLFLDVKCSKPLVLMDKHQIRLVAFNGGSAITNNQQLIKRLQYRTPICLQDVSVYLKLSPACEIQKIKIYCKGITIGLGQPSEISFDNLELDFTLIKDTRNFPLSAITYRYLRRLFKKGLLVRWYYTPNVVNIENFVRQPPKKVFQKMTDQFKNQSKLLEPLDAESKLMLKHMLDYVNKGFLLTIVMKYRKPERHESIEKQQIVPTDNECDLQPFEKQNINIITELRNPFNAKQSDSQN